MGSPSFAKLPANSCGCRKEEICVRVRVVSARSALLCSRPTTSAWQIQNLPRSACQKLAQARLLQTRPLHLLRTCWIQLTCLPPQRLAGATTTTRREDLLLSLAFVTNQWLNKDTTYSLLACCRLWPSQWSFCSRCSRCAADQASRRE